MIIFMTGLPHHLYTVLKSRNPESLEHCFKMTTDEELEYNSKLEMEKLQGNAQKRNVDNEKEWLMQLDKSSSLKYNLTPEFIENYITSGNKMKVVVLWNRHSNRNVLKRLNTDKFENPKYNMLW